MSMTVTEANAVSTIADHLIGGRQRGGTVRAVTPAALCDALEVLTAGAYKRLMAGWRPADVRAAFDDPIELAEAGGR